MGDEQFQREEDQRYRQIDRVLDKADNDASDDHADARDGEERPESNRSDG